MKKVLICCLALLVTAPSAHSALNSNEINVLNIKQNNMYLLNLKSRALKINTFNNKNINIFPVASLSNNDEEIFVEMKQSGVCDVEIETAKDNYKIRFIAGNLFEDKNESLMQIDIPTVIK